MDPHEYELMFQVEEYHWWYRGMETITRAMFERWIRSDNLKILDAGCGTGAAMTTYLLDYGTITGVDLYPQALEYCKKRNAPRLARASVTDLPFAPASFDLVTSFDVLYEQAVTSDRKALNEFFRILSPGGRILLRLPAYDWLRGQHDRVVHTKQRYTKRLVRELLEQCGFVVEHLTHANTLLFPLAVLKRLSEKIFPPVEASDLSLKTGFLNNTFRYILSREAYMAAHIGLPYGLSLFAVGRK